MYASTFFAHAVAYSYHFPLTFYVLRQALNFTNEIYGDIFLFACSQNYPAMFLCNSDLRLILFRLKYFLHLAIYLCILYIQLFVSNMFLIYICSVFLNFGKYNTIFPKYILHTLFLIYIYINSLFSTYEALYFLEREKIEENERNGL